MNNEIIKLAKECRIAQMLCSGNERLCAEDFYEELEAFYKAAYNKAIDDAAKVCKEPFSAAIKELEMR